MTRHSPFSLLTQIPYQVLPQIRDFWQPSYWNIYQWSLWELNPSDFLLAKQATTPCSLKHQIQFYFTCFGDREGVEPPRRSLRTGSTIKLSVATYTYHDRNKYFENPPCAVQHTTDSLSLFFSRDTRFMYVNLMTSE